MKSQLALLTAFGVFGALLAGPAYLLGSSQQAGAIEHEQHHPDAASAPPASQTNMMAAMKASDAKIDELMKKMNAAKGSEKADAIAEVLTAVIEDHRAMCASMMANMPMMSNMMNMKGMAGHGDTPQAPH